MSLARVVGILSGTVAIGLILLGVAATRPGTHRGTVTMIPENKSDPRPYTYVGEIEPHYQSLGGHSFGGHLFGGNSLFRISDAKLTQSIPDVVSEEWEPSQGTGICRLTTLRPIADGSRLPVSYDLSIRWSFWLMLITIFSTTSLALLLVRQTKVDLVLLKSPNAARLAVGMLIVGSAMLISNIVASPGWVYGDDMVILSTIVHGEPMMPNVYPDLGRFFPLGLVDLNLLLPFGNMPLAYHLQRALLLVLLIVVLYRITRQASGALVGSVLTLIFLTSPSLYQVYSDSIFPEAMISLLVGVTLMVYLHAKVSDRRTSWILVCVASTWATYCKEPVFGLFAVFALVQIVFGLKQMSRREFMTNLFLLLNGAIFLSLYYWLIFDGGEYAGLRSSGQGHTLLRVWLDYCEKPLVLVAQVLACWRLYWLIVHKDRSSLVYDGALLAGVVYLLAFVALKLGDRYFLIPSYVCWMVAIAGYFGRTQHRILALLSHHADSVSRFDPKIVSKRRKQVAWSIGLLLAIGCVQLPGTFEQIKIVGDRRKETRHLTQSFGELESRGYRVYMFYPPEMEGFQHVVQDWRRSTLNSFHRTARDSFDQTGNPTAPLFQPIDRDQLTHPECKYIVIHDPMYSIESLRKPDVDSVSLQTSILFPSVMGAELYAPESEIEVVKEVFNVKRGDYVVR